MATQKLKNNEINQNADTYSNQLTGFRIGCRNCDKERNIRNDKARNGRNDTPSLSFYGESFSSLSFYGESFSSLSPSGLTGGSTRKQCRLDSRLRGNDRGESGRSMVEMLGTLAIIGVLSIGGIAGYNYAINKYRANETINEINMRLMTLQNQSERDMDLNLNEFSDTTPLGYTIGDNYGWAEDDTRVYVGVSGLPKGTCEIIYDEMITKVERIDVTADRTADVNTLCGDNNEMKVYVGSGVEASCDPACGEDEYCMSGIKCVKAWKDERIKCTSGDNTPCGECMTCHGWGICTPKNNGKACDGGNGICLSGVCTPVENSCSEHSDCPDDYYCAPKPGVCDSEKEGYKCAPLDFSYYPVKLSDGTTELWYKSNQYMYWQNAMAACAALDKTIPTVAEWRKLPQIENLPGEYWTSSNDPKSCNMAYIMNSGAPWQSKALDIAYAICR